MSLFHVASFDVEEHYRIEAAHGLSFTPEAKGEYARRMEATTRQILDQLAAANVKATFYIVGQIAKTHAALVRDIHAAGHEVGSHSWDHRRVHHFKADTFREDLLRSKEALEDVTGEAVVGFRAPTFSIVRETGWAVDVLAECGFEYDSSIFPVRHDRYGIRDAPRGPFLAMGQTRELLELPPLTYRLLRLNLPVAGGGYFRLFPLRMMRAGMNQAARAATAASPRVSMLYFHPWEFDPDQPRLPLRRLARWRTYVGMRHTTERMQMLLSGYHFTRAIDAARAIGASGVELPRFKVSA
ncbi:MAG TPA: XrtA system polysaccharide deacetylase [Gemmata sp.]|nr:XrtA system polysaccharide deacetylase [Gemmata sp.]